MSGPLVRAVGLKKYYKVRGGLLHAVDEVDLEIQPGESLGVVGESGCGKTTLGRTVLMLTPPTGGKIFFDGVDLTALSRKERETRRRDMQIIFQDPYSSLNPRMTIRELILEPILINKVCPSRPDSEKRVTALMDTVGLASRLASSYPHELDGGRRQRVGVARALALESRFIVCDEPVSALDVSIQAQILNLLMDLQKDMGLTYLFITHDLSVVRHISNHIMVMYLGRCIEKAPAKELFLRPMHPYTAALLAAIPVPSLEMRNREIPVIKGEVTSPINPIPACRFAPRCDRCVGLCHKGEPKLAKVDEDHFVACFLYD